MEKESQNKKHPHQPDFFEQFSESEQEEMKEIWEETGQLQPTKPEIRDHEMNRAWEKVDRRTQPAPASFNGNYTWMAAAAAVTLLLVATAYLLIPRTVNAPRGAMVTATLPDGSTVELNSGTEISYSRLYGFTNRTISLDGEAYFSVKNDDQPFIVQTTHSTIRVTGTKFNIRARHGEPGPVTEVAVTEGAVRFYRSDFKQQFVAIQAGEMSRLSDRMNKPTMPQPAAIEKISGWRTNQLMFDDKSLAVIFNELERRFDVQISVPDPAITNQTLSAYYANPQQLESVLKDICRVKGLKYARTAGGYRVYE